MDFTTSSDHPSIFFSHSLTVDQPPLAREDTLGTFLSDLNGSDAATEGSGSQESQVSVGGLERRLTEEAASFAAMEIEPDHQSPLRIATRKSTSSSESQVDSQNSQSTSSPSVLMIDSPPQSLIRLWSPPPDIEHRPNISLTPVEEKEPADEGMLLLFHNGDNAVTSSSRATSHSSGIRRARNDDADDDSGHEGGLISRPDYTRRTEKKRRQIKNTVLDTRGRHRRGKSQRSCPVCLNYFADESSLIRHRSAFKMHPACLDLDAAPLTVYRCRVDECTYRDHRRDNVLNHEAAHHPGEHDRNNVATITYSRADLEALMNADQLRNLG